VDPREGKQPSWCSILSLASYTSLLYFASKLGIFIQRSPVPGGRGTQCCTCPWTYPLLLPSLCLYPTGTVICCLCPLSCVPISSVLSVLNNSSTSENQGKWQPQKRIKRKTAETSMELSSAHQGSCWSNCLPWEATLEDLSRNPPTPNPVGSAQSKAQRSSLASREHIWNSDGGLVGCHRDFLLSLLLLSIKATFLNLSLTLGTGQLPQ
jgi:hypothetical protein